MADSKGLVTVEWKGYCAALMNGVWKSFHDQHFVDISLTCHQQRMKVHRLILAVFFQGLKDSLTETAGDGLADTGNGVRELCLDHLSKDEQGADVLRYLIDFAYSGKVALPEHRLRNVMEAAEVVGFEGLVQSIRDQMNKRGIAVSDMRTSSSGLMASTASSDVNSVPTAADGALTRPKRSNRKGIPKKLIKPPRRQDKAVTVMEDESPDEDAISDPELSKRRNPPVETTRGIRLHMRNRNIQMESSDDDNDDNDSGDFGVGADPLSSASNSKDPSSEDDSDSQDGDWTSANEKSLRPTMRSNHLLPKSDSGPESKKPRRSPTKPRTPGSKRTRVEDRELLKCERCAYSTTSKLRFIAHSRRHEKKVSTKLYQCQHCPKVFRSNKGYRDHLVCHNPELQHQCKFCPFVTNQKWSLRHHMAVKHLLDEDGNPVTKQLQCPDCLYECVTSRQLAAHTLIKHTKNPLKCDLCDYVSPRQHRIKEHMAVMHGSDDQGNAIGKSQKCAECDYTCFTKAQMNDHMLRRHTSEKPHMCEECGYTTAVKGELHRHIDRVHRGLCRYMCDICGKRIKAHSGLVRHKRSHFGLKPFKCTLCGQAFADRHNLKAHNERHMKRNEMPNASGMDEHDIPRNLGRNCEIEAELTAGGAAKSPKHSSLEASKPDADAVPSGSADLDEGSDSSPEDAAAHLEASDAGRKRFSENRMSDDAARSVERLAYEGGIVDGFVGLRAAVERFEGLGSCSGMLQEL